MQYIEKRADQVRPGETLVVVVPATSISDPYTETTVVVTIASTIAGRTRLEFAGGSRTYRPAQLVCVVEPDATVEETIVTPEMATEWLGESEDVDD